MGEPTDRQLPPEWEVGAFIWDAQQVKEGVKTGGSLHKLSLPVACLSLSSDIRHALAADQLEAHEGSAHAGAGAAGEAAPAPVSSLGAAEDAPLGAELRGLAAPVNLSATRCRVDNCQVVLDSSANGNTTARFKKYSVCMQCTVQENASCTRYKPTRMSLSFDSHPLPLTTVLCGTSAAANEIRS